MPFGRKSPLEALALPGVILAYKYSQFRQRRREAASRRVTERELSALHHKIDKLLSKLEESEPEPPASQEDECVICINAKATMQTSPCGHRVVCRRCFVKTIQSAVAQRMLPLRCVICRARVNRLTSSSGTWRIQESASSYSVGGKSWSSSASTSPAGVPQSASSYSMGHEPSPQLSHPRQQLTLPSSNPHQHQHHHHHHQQQHNHRHNHLSPNPNNRTTRVTQSASLYSMQSGSSSISNSSNVTSCSNTSSVSSGIDSTGSIVSSSGSSTTSSNFQNPNTNRTHQHHHLNHSTCPTGCLGAIPRRPSINSMSAMPITNTYPGRRYTKGRIADLQQNRLPPIKEFRSPIHNTKTVHASPVHPSNLRFRYSSYTKSTTNNSHDLMPLLKDPSPTRHQNQGLSKHYQNTTNISTTTTTTISNHKLSTTSKLGLTAKVNPIASKIPIQKNSLTSPTATTNLIKKKSNGDLNHSSSSKSYTFANNGGNSTTTSTTNTTKKTSIKTTINNNNLCNNKSAINLRNLHQEEKADNKKNETMEKKKKDEKLKLKAEKEARKEEKRLAKEEERLAKLLAKEEKKKGKREAKELLLAHDGNNKK